jgi:AcrR family transcriptional regulator
MKNNATPGLGAGRLAEIWPGLSRRQKEFVLAMQKAGMTKKDAAAEVGLTTDTVYRWPKTVDEAIELYLEHAAEAAMAELTSALATAALGKVQEMASNDPVIASKARTEILDRGIGKPTQHVKSENTHEVDVTEGRLAGVLDRLVNKAAQLPDEEDLDDADEQEG